MRHFFYHIKMQINFQNLPQANSEILKAFNSQTAAKALEAYQPLDEKSRARQKLKALQLLKQSSNSLSIANISLSTDSLSASLSQADGPTLQAMLNLLSAKMIEQNKNTVVDNWNNRHKKRKKVETVDKDAEEQAQQQKQKEEEPKKEEEKGTEELSRIQEMLQNAETYLNKAKEDLLRMYKGILDIFSLRKLQTFFTEQVQLLKKYAYDYPLELLEEKILEPIYRLPQKLKQSIDTSIDNLKSINQKETFTADEIRKILGQSIDYVFNESLEQSIKSLDENLANGLPERIRVKAKERQAKMAKVPGVHIPDMRMSLHKV